MTWQQDGRSLAAAMHHLAVSVAAADVAVAHELEMNHTDYVALKHLMVADDPMTPAQLSRLLGLSSGSTTAVLDRLERAGHAERRPHPGDRRKLHVSATPAAHDRVEAALAPLAARVQGAEQAMTAAERRTVLRFIEQATAANTAHRSATVERRAGPER